MSEPNPRMRFLTHTLIDWVQARGNLGIIVIPRLERPSRCQASGGQRAGVPAISHRLATAAEVPASAAGYDGLVARPLLCHLPLELRHADSSDTAAAAPPDDACIARLRRWPCRTTASFPSPSHQLRAVCTLRDLTTSICVIPAPTRRCPPSPPSGTAVQCHAERFRARGPHERNNFPHCRCEGF